MDTATRGALGESLVEAELLRLGVEVARPAIDRGIDLLAFTSAPRFKAIPIQVKAASAASFTVHRKWADIDGLVLIYVWDVPASPSFRPLTYEEALAVASGWTDLAKSVSWNNPNPKKGNHDWSSLPAGRRRELDRFKDRWKIVLRALGGS